MSKKWIYFWSIFVGVLSVTVIVLYTTTNVFEQMWEGILWLCDKLRGGGNGG